MTQPKSSYYTLHLNILHLDPGVLKTVLQSLQLSGNAVWSFVFITALSLQLKTQYKPCCTVKISKDTIFIFFFRDFSFFKRDHLAQCMREDPPIWFLFQAPDHQSSHWQTPKQHPRLVPDNSQAGFLLLPPLAEQHWGGHVDSAQISQNARLGQTKVELAICSHWHCLEHF